jgi:hypothetical protein
LSGLALALESSPNIGYARLHRSLQRLRQELTALLPGDEATPPPAIEPLVTRGEGLLVQWHVLSTF